MGSRHSLRYAFLAATCAVCCAAPALAQTGRVSGVVKDEMGQPNAPLRVTLKRGAVAATGALAGLAAKDLQTDLAAAEQMFNARRWDEAIAAYKAVLAKAPALTAI